MTTESYTSETDDRYAAAVAEYLTARDAGRPIPPADWLSRYPDLAPQLREFLDDGTVVDTFRSFRGTTREPNLHGDERFVGDYELLEKIGGNMGVVYRARQQSLPRETAVKLLLKTGSVVRERFRAEAEAMARLVHPHVIRILEVSRGDGLPYFSMELCPGGTLAGRVGKFTAHPDRAADLVEKVSRAIQFAHHRGILHRDLKPANILFDEFDQPRVADFGLAIPVTGADASFARAGTPAYMAPEQLTGDVTVATDVFGLGAVLYELLTGRPPHDGPSLTIILDRVKAANPIAPLTLDPRIDPDLDAICRKCLACDPAKRYGSAGDLADDLVRYRQGRPTMARPLGLYGHVTHLVRRVRAAGEFRSLAPGLFGMAGFVLASNAAVFALLQTGAREIFVWVCLFASYALLVGIFAREGGRRPDRFSPGRALLWSLWGGHAIASVSLFLANRIAAGDDFVRGIQTGYVGCAGVNALAYVVMGSLFTGRQYFLGLAWAAAAVGMGFFLPAAPLIYAVLMAGCNILTGLHLRGIQDEDGKSTAP